MRALVYHGPRKVSVDEVPDATIEKPTDAAYGYAGLPKGGYAALVSSVGR